MAVKRIQAIVSGRVQGVGFRYFAVHVAHRLGVAGTVRNLASGSIEAIAEGEETQLTAFVDELRAGPSTAAVSDIQVAWGEPEGASSSFLAVS